MTDFKMQYQLEEQALNLLKWTPTQVAKASMNEIRQALSEHFESASRTTTVSTVATVTTTTTPSQAKKQYFIPPVLQREKVILLTGFLSNQNIINAKTFEEKTSSETTIIHANSTNSSIIISPSTTSSLSSAPLESVPSESEKLAPVQPDVLYYSSSSKMSSSATSVPSSLNSVPSSMQLSPHVQHDNVSFGLLEDETKTNLDTSLNLQMVKLNVDDSLVAVVEKQSAIEQFITTKAEDINNNRNNVDMDAQIRILRSHSDTNSSCIVSNQTEMTTQNSTTTNNNNDDGMSSPNELLRCTPVIKNVPGHTKSDDSLKRGFQVGSPEWCRVQTKHLHELQRWRSQHDMLLAELDEEEASLEYQLLQLSLQRANKSIQASLHTIKMEQERLTKLLKTKEHVLSFHQQSDQMTENENQLLHLLKASIHDVTQALLILNQA